MPEKKEFVVQELTGSLFKNRRRETETQPQMKGECKIGGVVYWVNAWTNTDKNGDKYQSLKFSPKEDAPQRSAPKRDGGLQIDDDLPF